MLHVKQLICNCVEIMFYALDAANLSRPIMLYVFFFQKSIFVIYSASL